MTAIYYFHVNKITAESKMIHKMYTIEHKTIR